MKKIFTLGALILLFLAIGSMAKAKEPYKLNVIYFLPQGDQPVEGYESRLNDLLLYVQDFYRYEMKRNGFGNKTFGLEKTADKRVKILVIRGKHDIPYYSYDNGGGWKAEREIEAYFKANPGTKKSHHALVIMPSTSGDDMNPGGVPFYGIGKYCFALDYKYFDIKYLGEDSEKGRLLTKWFGGMAHELGHGLNLPHNKEQVSVGKEHGTALMGSGNYTFGQKPTFLTKASCAILNNCEVFAQKEMEYYNKNTGFQLKEMEVDFPGTSLPADEIVVKGVFETKIPVNAVNVYVDHAPFGQVNNDYDAESWTVKPDKNNHFALRIPCKELHTKHIDSFQVRVRFLFENGIITTQTADFKWNDLVPYRFNKIK